MYLMGGPLPGRGTPRCPAGPARPSDVAVGATCLLHLRADLGITINGSGEVTSWADQSGAGDSGRDFAPPGTDKPLWNACYDEPAYGFKPTVGPFRKAGLANDCRLVSGTWNAQYGYAIDGLDLHIFVIGHSTYNAPRIFVYGTDNERMEMSTVDGSEPSSPSALVATSGGFPDGLTITSITSTTYLLNHSGPNLLGALFGGTHSKTYFNRLDTPNATGTLAGTIRVGHDPLTIGNGGGSYIDALLHGVERIAEVMIYHGTLPAPGLVVLGNYWNARYKTSFPV